MVGTDLLEFIATPEINSRVTNVGYHYSLWFTVGGRQRHEGREGGAHSTLLTEAAACFVNGGVGGVDRCYETLGCREPSGCGSA